MQKAIIILLLSLTCVSGHAKTDLDYPVGIFKCTERYTDRQSEVAVTTLNLDGKTIPLVEFSGNSTAVARDDSDNVALKGIATVSSLGQDESSITLTLQIDVPVTHRYRAEKLALLFTNNKLHYINSEECEGDWTTPRVKSPSELPPPELARYKALYESFVTAAVVSDFDKLGEATDHVCELAYFQEDNIGGGFGGTGSLIIRQAQMGNGPVKLVANTVHGKPDSNSERSLLELFYEHSTLQETESDLVATVTGKYIPGSQTVGTIGVLSLRKKGDQIAFKMVIPRPGKSIQGYGFCSRS